HIIRLCFFFFSSRRRHTRSTRDWSSDVCSSDLATATATLTSTPTSTETVTFTPTATGIATPTATLTPNPMLVGHVTWQGRVAARSEERRVGKECGAGGAAWTLKKKEHGWLLSPR